MEEQGLLEELLESRKPPLPRGAEFRGLHYLLTTPFRYAPLRHGSRFGTRGEQAIWYGSTQPRTAFAETAYYRLLFLEGTTADLAPIEVELSLFQVSLRTTRGVDLTRRPFDRQRAAIASPVDYSATQLLGREMREDGVHAFRYPSARDRVGGTNLALFTPAAFVENKPSTVSTWHCVAIRGRIELTKKDVFSRRSFAFPRDGFLVGGRLPAPAP
jgi:hypothetical protein